MRVLVVDDERAARSALSQLLKTEGYDVLEAKDGAQGLAVVEREAPDIVLTDIRMPVMDGFTFLERALEVRPDLCVVMMTAYASVDTAIDAMKQGAYHYLTKPLNFDEVALQLERCAERVRLQTATSNKPDDSLVGTSELFLNAIALADAAAQAKSTVMLLGESGTGKELFARRIHKASRRNQGPFIAVNCGAIPETLLESEFFGHEKGAFTGAEFEKLGVFEAADGGTLFLDEVGDVSLAQQVALLRVLQEREIRRVGGTRSIPVDVRIICATHKDLAAEVEAGRFREDLFYRLNVIPIDIPPLRARVDDIPDLTKHFVAIIARDNDKRIDNISSEAVEVLERHTWPGNVRELQNTLERAVVLCSGTTLEPKHFAIEKRGSAHARPTISIPGSTMAEIERYAILETYRICAGDTQKTADRLAISRRKVQYVLKAERDGGTMP